MKAQSMARDRLRPIELLVASKEGKVCAEYHGTAYCS